MWFYQVFAPGTELGCPAKYQFADQAAAGAWEHAHKSGVAHRVEAILVSNDRCMTDLSHDKVWGVHVKRTPVERAAPQMLAALKMLEQYLQTPESSYHERLARLANVRAIIAAAERKED